MLQQQERYLNEIIPCAALASGHRQEQSIVLIDMDGEFWGWLVKNDSCSCAGPRHGREHFRQLSSLALTELGPRSSAAAAPQAWV